MVQFDHMIPRLMLMGMDKEQQGAAQAQNKQWYRPRWMPNPPDPAEHFTHRRDRTKHPIEFMLNNFRVLPGEGLEKGQGPDRPGLMVTPYQEIRSNDRESTRQNEPDPKRQLVP
jgi:hypothetical protein